MQQPKLPGKHQVECSIVMNASQAEVWTVLEDFANVHAWAPSVKKSHAIGKGKNCVGAGRHCELDGFGAIDEYITLWKEGTGFVYSVSALGPLDKAHSSWWLTSVSDDKCRLSVELNYDIRFGLFGQLMHKLIMRKKLESSLPDTLNAVKTEVARVQSTPSVKLVAA